MEYSDLGITTANQIYVPVGQVVEIALTSNDVIHSFWVPQLQFKRDLIPGQTNAIWLQADKPGIYRGLCAEYCGLQEYLVAWIHYTQVMRPGSIMPNTGVSVEEAQDIAAYLYTLHSKTAQLTWR